MRPFVVPCMLSFLVLAPGRAGGDQWEKSYPVSGRAEVRIHANEGSVEATSWDRPSVRLEVSTTGWRIGGEVRVVERRVGGRIELEVRPPSWGFWIGSTHNSIAIHAWLPRESDLDVETGDGDIGVRALRGRVDAHTGDGSIRAHDLGGDVRLDSGDGNIEATGLEGALRAHSGDGHLIVGGRFEALDLSSGDGNLTVETEPGSKLARPWEFKTGDGNIMLRLGSPVAATLDARTGDGEVTLDVPITIAGTLSRTRLQGALNGGGPLLRLWTGDGSIRVASP